jgi:hypothetical protein
VADRWKAASFSARDEIVRRENLDLDAGTLELDDTLVSVTGSATESDGKS